MSPGAQRKAAAAVALAAVLLISSRGGWQQDPRSDTDSPAGKVETRAVVPTRPGPPPGLRAFLKTLAYIGSAKDSESREKLISSAVDEVAEPDTVEALEALLESRDEPTAARELAERLIRRWAALDVEAAAGWVGQMQDGPLRTAALAQVATIWCSRDLSAAADWARTMPPGRDGGEPLRQVAYETARGNPVAALDIADELEDGSTRDDLINHATLQWAGSDPAAAAEWAAQLEDSALRARVLAAVATAWADSDPAEAGRFAATSIAPGRSQDDAIIAVIQRWTQQDPQGAAGWVASFAETPLKTIALENLTSIWRSRDPAALDRWLSKR